MGFKDKLDDVAEEASERIEDVGERAGAAGGRVGEAGLAVGGRVATAGATATRTARERGTDLSERLDRVDPKAAADSAVWGFQAGSKVPGGPYSTALGTGLGAAYGAYSSVREDAVNAMEEGVEIEVTDEGEPVDRPADGEAMRASPGGERGLDGVLPRDLDLERASAMAFSSYDWYKRGRDRWGTKGGVAGAAFGVARHLTTGDGGDGDERSGTEPPR